MDDTSRKSQYLNHKFKFLREFSINVTREIEEKITTLYPNEIAIDNYIRSLILKQLNRYEN